LDKFFLCVHRPRRIRGPRTRKHAKKEKQNKKKKLANSSYVHLTFGQTPIYLDRTSLVNNGFFIWYKKQNFLAGNVKNEGGDRQEELSAVFFSFDRFREELIQNQKSFENSKQLYRNGVQKQSKWISMSLLRLVLTQMH
jgi:hypothetical protein